MMKIGKLLLFLALGATVGCGKNDQPAPVSATPAAATQAAGPSGRRTQVLTTPGDKLGGYQPDAEHPKVYGVLVDWHVGTDVLSVVAMMDGTGAIYSATGKDFVGSPAQPAVNQAAKACALLAGQLVDASKPVTTTDYPAVGQVFVQVLTFDGRRLLVASEDGIAKGTDPAQPVFAAAQELLNQLRLIQAQKLAPRAVPGTAVPAAPGSGTPAIPAAP